MIPPISYLYKYYFLYPKMNKLVLPKLKQFRLQSVELISDTGIMESILT